MKAAPPSAELVPVLRAAERFAAAIEARAIALMLKLDLTMAQLRTLTTIRRLGRANGRQLAGALGITPGAVVAVCDHLEQRGYVQRVADTVDRRVTWFELTELAHGQLRSTPPVAMAKARTRAFIAGLTPGERQGFIKIADMLVEALNTLA